MPALNADRNTPVDLSLHIDIPVAANTKIFAGSLVCTNASGFAVPAADSAGYRFMGVALEQMDNSTGANGAKVVRLRRAGIFLFDAASITQAMVGTPMYVVDDHTFDDASGPLNDIRIGLLMKYVSNTMGWIQIDA